MAKHDHIGTVDKVMIDTKGRLKGEGLQDWEASDRITGASGCPPSGVYQVRNLISPGGQVQVIRLSVVFNIRDEDWFLLLIQNHYNKDVKVNCVTC